jgi:serine/threonine-protein kinase
VVALLANRGFVTEEVALSRLDLSTLQATRIADARGSPTQAEFPVQRRRRASYAMMAVLALAAGLAAFLAG